MRRFTLAATLSTLLCATAIWASASEAAEYEKFGIETATASLSTKQAGAHPDFITDFRFTTDEGHPYAHPEDIDIQLPPGLVGNPQAFPRCTALQFGANAVESHCPQDSQIGISEITLGGELGATLVEPVFNMEAPGNGVAARLGFFSHEFPTFLNIRLRPDDHGLTVSVEGAFGAAPFIAANTTIWGVPASPAHDYERRTPREAAEETVPVKRESGLPEVPFMTNPTGCEAGRQISVAANTYQQPDVWPSKVAPFPDLSGCSLLKLRPQISLAPTTSQAESGAGLDVRLDLPTDGLQSPNLLADSALKRAEVTLPEGVTINPSEAEGLGVCSEADFARETYDSAPNAGCPESSKIGSVRATTPVLDEAAEGSLYIAKPYENPAGSLIALYMTLKVPAKGVYVGLVGKVAPDPDTGQLITTFGGAGGPIPDLPVSSFQLHFREGARAPLVTPPGCGRFEAAASFESWGGQQATARPSFTIESGPGHGPCPGADAPFDPGFRAGTADNAAGSYSAFQMQLTRKDGEQDLTRFSATLPPGLAAKLAGVSQCPDSAIAAARSKSGRDELASPSCPGSAQIGSVLAGAGVGSVLTYVPGKVYLAGPYNGAPLSVAAIVPAVAGPFDVGTVVTRQALRVNPRSAVVEVDGASSDPIPHILAGIPLKVRDIRVDVERPDFTFNPTSCEPFSVAATLWGGGRNVFSTLDDNPVAASDRFQAADCAALGFKPRLALRLKGGTRRGGHPSLHGVYRPRKGDSNLKRLVLRLPHSAFLDQAHIRTICTRVQYAADGGNGAGCPKASVYGHAKAWTPILDEPLQGPVYLRSSNHNLPDFVASLHGLVDVEAVARIDSKKGGIRATFTGVPDAPLSRVAVNMQGARKGLIVNSADLCRAKHRAAAAYTAHNARRATGKPLLRAAGCSKAKRKKHRRHRANTQRQP